MNSSTKRAIAAQAIILVAWLVAMFALRSILINPAVFMLSLVFGVIAFAVSAGSMALSDRQSQSQSVTEVNMLSAALAWGYFALSLIANGYFCFAAYAWIGTSLPVVVNVVLIAALVIIQMGLNANARQTDQRVTRVAAKVSQTAQFGSYVGQLIAMADDPALKVELKALKDDISFSSNMSQPHIQTIERQFQQVLESIADALSAAEPAGKALELTREARNLWRKRNAALTSVK